MTAICRIACLLVATYVGVAQADDARSRLLGKAVDEGRLKHLPPILFEVDRQEEILSSRDKLVPTANVPKLLPNRIYLVHNPPGAPENLWYFVLTDFEGHLPEPMEVIRWRSVFNGQHLGAKNPKQRFINIEKLQWVPSFKPEVHDFFTFTDPPFFRVEEFLPVVKKGTPK